MSEAAAPRPGTLTELVAFLEALPAERTVAVLDRRGRSRAVRTHAEVARRARGWAGWLAERGVAPGEVVFLCLPTSHDLVEGFLGAALLGALPCCLALPRAVGGLEVFRRRIERLRARFPGGWVVTTPEVEAELGGPCLVPPAEPGPPRELAGLPRPGPGDLAYIQLTSGSTTDPKAVAITHANLAANTRSIMVAGEGGEGPELSRREHFVSWLPLYHDMGLVGMLFTALFAGSPLVLMSPETFVGTPLRWLEAIAAAPGPVATSAPNFGYQWCVDRIPPEKVGQLDLSSWHIACCGAEMIRPATLEQFRARFVPHGFPPLAFAPCYGLAEGTLAVTMCAPGRAPRVVEGRVSCGPPVPGMEVLILPPGGGEPSPEGVEGEVVIRGTSVYAGYFLDPDATAPVLRDGAFHTGDLGYLHRGELVVTGRIKELLILDGVNVAPYELEWLAQQHLPLDGGRAAAFSVEVAGREVPVLVVEVKEAAEPGPIEALRGQVGRELAPLHDLVLVRRGTLPKTSSGKVQRNTVRARYLAGELEVIWRLPREEATT